MSFERIYLQILNMALELQDIVLIVIIAYAFSPHDLVPVTKYGLVGYIDDMLIAIVFVILIMYTFGLLAMLGCLNDTECTRQVQENMRQARQN